MIFEKETENVASEETTNKLLNLWAGLATTCSIAHFPRRCDVLLRGGENWPDFVLQKEENLNMNITRFKR